MDIPYSRSEIIKDLTDCLCGMTDKELLGLHNRFYEGVVTHNEDGSFTLNDTDFNEEGEELYYGRKKDRGIVRRAGCC
jgi:hypothetical protein